MGSPYPRPQTMMFILMETPREVAHLTQSAIHQWMCLASTHTIDVHSLEAMLAASTSNLVLEANHSPWTLRVTCALNNSELTCSPI